MKSFPKIIQETKIRLPPPPPPPQSSKVFRFSGMGFGREKKREQDDERKEQKKSSFKSEF